MVQIVHLYPQSTVHLTQLSHDQCHDQCRDQCRSHRRRGCCHSDCRRHMVRDMKLNCKWMTMFMSNPNCPPAAFLHSNHPQHFEGSVACDRFYFVGGHTDSK